MPAFVSRAVRVVVAVAITSAVLAACGSGDGSTFVDPNSEDSGGVIPPTGDFGQVDSGTGQADPRCKPRTCAEQNIKCGPAGDGCGGIIPDCGKCGIGRALRRPRRALAVREAEHRNGLRTRRPAPGSASSAGSPATVAAACSRAERARSGKQCGSTASPSKCVAAVPTGPDGGACVHEDVRRLPRREQGLRRRRATVAAAHSTAAGARRLEFCGGGGPSKCAVSGGGVVRPEDVRRLPGQVRTAAQRMRRRHGRLRRRALRPQICGGGGAPSVCGGGGAGPGGGACVPKAVVRGAGVRQGRRRLRRRPRLRAAGLRRRHDLRRRRNAERLRRADVHTHRRLPGGDELRHRSRTAAAASFSAVAARAARLRRSAAAAVRRTSAAAADVGPCVPKTCAQTGKQCGPVADGCGGLVDCPQLRLARRSAAAAVSRASAGREPVHAEDASRAARPTAAGSSPTAAAASSSAERPARRAGVCGETTPNVCGRRSQLRARASASNQDATCAAGSLTRITGKVYAPNGTLPLPGALVYVPNGAATIAVRRHADHLPASAAAARCEQCNQAASGSPLVSTTSAFDGSFTLNERPRGRGLPARDPARQVAPHDHDPGDHALHVARRWPPRTVGCPSGRTRAPTASTTSRSIAISTGSGRRARVRVQEARPHELREREPVRQPGGHLARPTEAASASIATTTSAARRAARSSTTTRRAPTRR